MDLRRILGTLGLNSPKWQWRAMRWQRQWEAWRDSLHEKRLHVTYQHKLCNECGGLMHRREKVCPQCQAPAPNWNVQAVMRLIGLALPKWNPVTALILGANVLNFLVLMALFGPQNLWRPQAEALVSMGALVPAYFFAGDYWRIMTYGYLHIGILHIGFNLFALSQVGPLLEDEVGPARFFVIYTLSLVGGGAADLVLRGGAPIIIAGASGALFGLIGFGVSYAHFYGGTLGRLQRNFFFRWAVYGFLFGLFIGADNIAHLGGLVSGAALGYLVANEQTGRKRPTSHWTRLAYLCSIATLLSFVWMVLNNR